MKILITGATGLIGSEIIKQCLDKKYEVHYLTTSKRKITEHTKCTGFYWNPKANEIDMECFTDVDAIINLAGATIAKKWTKEYKKEILHSRTASLQLLDTALQKLTHPTITAIVSASAIGIYPNALTHYYKEDYTEIDPSFLGEVVAKWEAAADQLRKHMIPIAKIRIGLVLAKHGGALPPIAKPIRYFVGAALGSGEHWQSWIHYSDIAALFLFAAEHRLEGIYNGVAPNPVTNAKLVKEIAAVLKRPLFLPNIPKKMLHMIFGEMAYMLYSSQRVSAEKIQQKGFSFQFKTVDNALKDLL